MTVTARETILARIRDAQALAPASAVDIPRDYRTGRTLPDADRLALLTDRLVDYKAEVHTCTADRTPEVIADVLRERAVCHLGIPPGLDRTWLSAYEGEVHVDSADTPVPELDALDGVLTSSAVTCAETGTIFLDASPDQGRRALTLVPDLHVCVVDLSTVTPGVPEAVTRLTPTHPTTLISGPSATSDIELERLEGVHGPRTLAVVIRTDM
ncbi:LutC/YkgG family protein [Streptomyces ochraceiscleroticus]|uniref:Lactate utilization protein C n=1 Tax=Streptomyces ochraceiscleroticus TaxID=47761 RepID=A0ABW1MD18_9ACTN|nr:LUD domain-containing protein [Streptomyces ochraceiscleroticus]